MRLPLSPLVCFVLLAELPLPAQTTPAPGRVPVLQAQVSPFVKNAPISAIRVMDFTPEQGVDAKSAHDEENFYRDSAGHTRSEIRSNGGPTTFTIVDHVANLQYTWREGGTVVNQIPLREYQPFESRPVLYRPDAPKIDGVPTHYFQRAGKSWPNEIIKTWLAGDLDLALDTEITWPGWGKASYRYTHINRAEPDPKLFILPEGMSVQPYGAPPPPTLLADKKPENTTTTTTASFPPAMAGPAPAYMSDPKFVKAYNDARTISGPDDEIESRWKKALKLSKGECIDCLKRLMSLQETMGASKDAQNTAEQLDKVATLPTDKYMARLMIGQMLMRSNYGSPKTYEAELAESSFHAALAILPNRPIALFEHGRSLAFLGRDEEARQEFEKYVDLTSDSDRYHLRAMHFEQNPHMSTLPTAPPFKLVTAQGEEMELDDMHGKVVLLDFWATWCGPCKATLPEIKRIAKDFKNDPLVVISISSDQDAVAWKKFIQDNNMHWPQYRDANGALQRAYSVNAIPHYFTIDSNGVLQTEMVGSDADVHGKLKKLVKQAREANTNSLHAANN